MSKPLSECTVNELAAMANSELAFITAKIDELAKTLADLRHSMHQMKMPAACALGEHELPCALCGTMAKVVVRK